MLVFCDVPMCEQIQAGGRLPYTGMTGVTDGGVGFLLPPITTVAFNEFAKITLRPGTVLSSVEVDYEHVSTDQYQCDEINFAVQYSTDANPPGSWPYDGQVGNANIRSSPSWTTACSLTASTGTESPSCTSGFPSTSVSFLRIVKELWDGKEDGCGPWFYLEGLKLYGEMTQALMFLL